MGDLNAHQPWWQGPVPHTAHTSSASHAIAHWLEHNNFHLQNKPAIPTHHPRNGSNPSTIDLFLTHRDTTRSALSLAIDDDTTSDHSSLTLTLSLPYTTPPPKPYRCWAKADWNSFGSHIQATRMNLSDLQSPEATLRAVSNITLLIHQATEATVPYKSQRKVEAAGGTTASHWQKKPPKGQTEEPALPPPTPTDKTANTNVANGRQWYTMQK